jgi:hypothetical protein
MINSLEINRNFMHPADAYRNVLALMPKRCGAGSKRDHAQESSIDRPAGGDVSGGKRRQA